MSNKKFCWDAKKVEFGNWWSMRKLRINLNEISRMPTDKYWNIRLDVIKKSKKDQYGWDYYVALDDYFYDHMDENNLEYNNIEYDESYYSNDNDIEDIF